LATKIISLYLPNKTDKTITKDLSEFVDILNNNKNINIKILTNNFDKTKILKRYIQNNYSISSINDFDKFSDYHNGEFYEIFDKYHLSRLRGYYQSNKLGIKFNDYIIYLISEFSKYLSDNKVNYILIQPLESPTSISVPVLDAVCNYNNIKILYPLASIIQGRFAIYDNMNRVSKDLQILYNETLNHGLDDNQKENVLMFMDKFIDFKYSQSFHDRIFRIDNPLHINVPMHKKSKNIMNYFRKKFFNPYFIFKVLINKYFFNSLKKLHASDYNIKKVFNLYDSFDRKNKYVILLLNKPLNYRSHFILPYYSDFSFLVKTLAISLPPEYSLLIKDHPQTSIVKSYQIINTIQQYDNCYYLNLYKNTFDYVRHADLVITTSSNTSVESLFLNKKVIEFGNSQYFFGNHSAPLYRINDIEKTRKIVSDVLKSPVNNESIISYIYSILKTSFSIVGKDDDWSIIDKHIYPRSEYYKKIANVLSKNYF